MHSIYRRNYQPSDPAIALVDTCHKPIAIDRLNPDDAMAPDDADDGLEGAQDAPEAITSPGRAGRPPDPHNPAVRALAVLRATQCAMTTAELLATLGEAETSRKALSSRLNQYRKTGAVGVDKDAHGETRYFAIPTKA